MANDVLKVSQKTAFLIFLVFIILAAPVVYAYITFSGRFFTASPEWWSAVLIPTVIAAVVLALVSVPLLRKLGAPWSATFGGSLCVMGMIAGLMLWYLPMIMTFMVREQVSWPVTVSSTVRSGKDIKCNYPFSIAEIWQDFCATSEADYTELRTGRKIEVVGLGSKYGMFIDGYRLVD